MFVILVYDVAVKRVRKVHHLVRRYLTPVQQSVFEGRLSDRTLRALQADLKDLLVPDEDGVVIYLFESLKFSHRLVLGRHDENPEIL